MSIEFYALQSLFKRPPQHLPQHPKLKTDLQDIAELDEVVRRQIRCVICHHVITNKENIKTISGAHIYEFTNPQGISFTIGCFDRAPGCVPAGAQYSEWSWFQGYKWQLALCAACSEHLGWSYLNDNGSTFFGLIIARLTYDQSDL